MLISIFISNNRLGQTDQTSQVSTDIDLDVVAICEINGSSRSDIVKFLSKHQIVSFLYGSRSKKLFVEASKSEQAEELIRGEQDLGKFDFVSFLEQE
jgi:hypothetical protein